MSWPTPWTYGMIDASPEAEERRRVHGIRNEARRAAEAAHMAEHAGDPDPAQTRLDADQAGQRAYWANSVHPQ